MILHIFKKDIYQQRYSIAGVIITTAIWTLSNASGIGPRSPVGGTLIDIATGAMILAWVLFTAGLVHAEALVGSTQYWLVRPIRTLDLFLAKLLSLFAVVIGTATISQVAFLTWLGFAPYEYWSKLILRLAWDASCWVIPAMLLAAMTRNLQQLAICMIAIGTAVAAATAWLFVFYPGRPEEFANFVRLSQVIGLGTLGFALTAWQYAARRTGLVRAITAALSAVLIVLPFQLPATAYSFMRTLASKADPNSFAITVSRDPRTKARLEVRGAGMRNVVIPIQVEGIPDGWRADVSLASLRTINLGVNRDFFGQIHQDSTGRYVYLLVHEYYLLRPLELRAVANITLKRQSQRLRIPANSGVRYIPGLGRCQSWINRGVLLDCSTPFWFDVNASADLVAEPPRKLRLPLLSQRTSIWPLPGEPIPVPVSHTWGHFTEGRNDSDANYDGTEIEIEIWETTAYLQRPINLNLASPIE